MPAGGEGTGGSYGWAVDNLGLYMLSMCPKESSEIVIVTIRIIICKKNVGK